MKLFEFGNIYEKQEQQNQGSGVMGKFNEPSKLALWITGRKEKESWKTNEEHVDYFYLKAIVSNILNSIGIELTRLESKKENQSHFSEVVVYNHEGKVLCSLGQISNKLLDKFEIKQDVYYAEFNWEVLMQSTVENEIRYKEIAKFPEVRRDLALLIDKNILFADIEKLAYQVENKILKEVNLFDIYEGKNIETGKKSYAVSFVLQDENKTLTDKVIDKIMQKMMKTFENKLNATIR